MGLSVLEAADACVKYLDSDRKLGYIFFVFFTLLFTYVLRPSPESPGAFNPVYTF